jgi:Ca2+/H+ antiporter
MRKIAYGATVALTIAVVIAELLHAPVLLLFALTSLALIGLAWILGQATESLGHYAGPRVGAYLTPPSATPPSSSSPYLPWQPG